MPSMNPPSQAPVADLPPAYTPHDLPHYTYTDPHTRILAHTHTHTHPGNRLLPNAQADRDRGKYALAIMMHNLRVNGLSLTDASPSPTPTPTSLYSAPSTSTPRAPKPLPTPPISRPPSPPLTPPRSPVPPTTATPSPSLSQSLSPSIIPTSDLDPRDRCLRAAMRDFRASNNPEMWGRRIIHGRRTHLLPEQEEEEEGFWSWLGDLFVIRDERGNPIPLGATSPWGIIGPGGAF